MLISSGKRKKNTIYLEQDIPFLSLLQEGRPLSTIDIHMRKKIYQMVS